MPLRPCIQCGTPCVSGRCHRHRRPGAQARGYTGQWQAIAQSYYGLPCALRLPGCTHIADTGDHIIPLARGGSNDETNSQPACRHCNSAKRDQVKRQADKTF